MTRYALSLTVALGALAAALSADPKPQNAAEDAKRLDGRWKLAHPSGKFVLGDKKVPALVEAIDTEKAVVRFDKGTLVVEGGNLTAAFEYDLNLPEQQKQIENSVAGHRLVKITPKGGESFFVSYSASENNLQIRYPAGCCSRSGMVIDFERVK